MLTFFFFFSFLILLFFVPVNFFILIFILPFLILKFLIFNFNYLILLIFLPLINVVLNYFFLKHYLSKKIILFNTVLVIFLIFLKSLYLLLFLIFDLNLNFNFIYYFTLSITNFNNLIFVFNFDILTLIMIFTISFISFLVHFYSIDYMLSDKNQINFLLILNLFTFFMIFLVIAGNTIQLFIGWEGVGITSYLLINFWYNRFEANKSSLKALTLNKLGDICLLLFIGTIFYFFETSNLLVLKTYLFYLSFNFNFEYNLILFCGFLLLICSIAKSAQLGLHTWLPDAMEGPTPVSALLHAATMVTAGIYLLVRFNFLIHKLPELLILISFFGSLTALIGSLFATVQNDIKKIIAFSTLSQLGYMFCSIGFTGYNYAMFHLVTHAPFKALLFLSAGIIIHNFNNNQDLRKYGILVQLIPILYIFTISATLALIGFPFFSGFYSKDLILELTLNFSLNSYFYFFISFCLNFGAFLTTIYSLRLIYYTFFIKLNFNLTYLKNIKDVNFIQFYSLFPLVFGSIFFGYFLFNYFVGYFSFFVWKNVLISFFPLILIENLTFSIKSIPLLIFSSALIYSFLTFCNSFQIFNLIKKKVNFNFFILFFLFLNFFYFNFTFFFILILVLNLILINFLSYSNFINFLILLIFIFFNNFNFLILISLILNLKKITKLIFFINIKYLQKKFFFDLFLNRLIAKPIYSFYYFVCFYLIDRGILQNSLESISTKNIKKLKSYNLQKINYFTFEFKFSILIIFFYLIFILFFCFFLFYLKKKCFF